MDYQQDHQEAFSRTQIERMHYFLLGHSGDIYKVNSSAVTTPTPSITGPSVLCPIGADYFVSNHQLGTVVSWSVSPSNAVQVSSGSGTSAHLVSNSTYSGSASITFLVNYGYFGTKSNSYSFTVGNGIYGTVTSGGSTTPLVISHAVSSTSVSASIDAPGATSFTWTKTSGSGSWYTYNNGKSLSLTLSPSGQISFNISTASSTCGPLSKNVTFFHTGGYYSFYPNPTTGDLYVEVLEDEIEIDVPDDDGKFQKEMIKLGMEKLSLHDKNGNLIKYVQVNIGSKKATISLDGLAPDVYLVIVEDGDLLIESKIIKT